MLTNKQKADIADAIANTKNQAGQTLADLIAQAHKANKEHEKTSAALALATQARKAEENKGKEATRAAIANHTYHEFINRPTKQAELDQFATVCAAEEKAERVNQASTINETEARRAVSRLSAYIGVYVCGLSIGKNQLADFADMIRDQFGDNEPETHDRLGLRFYDHSASWECGRVDIYCNSCEPEANAIYWITSEDIKNEEAKARTISELTAPAKTTTAAKVIKAYRIKKEATAKAEKILQDARDQVNALTCQRLSINYTLKNY